MSRKDVRKSLSVCPSREVWVSLKARAGCSLSDLIRREVAGVDWVTVPVGTAGRGTELSVQLPSSDLEALEDAAFSRKVPAELLVLGALSEALK